ncbi:hypothetical protein J3R30DRAFT_3733787 [Lentinula aciculospora]|uniref:DEAD-domain-containing protein n=1 Tax=Lentinula aciculospora TaxID=153920 RepID=A0A9W9DN78_9AGAR|nr:hypothetical protein J3R30DRAFT_3733787 [Lentinula aciculospora]
MESLWASSKLLVIKKLNHTVPTSIQAQAIPAIMSGRDVIGVAETGQGRRMPFCCFCRVAAHKLAHTKEEEKIQSQMRATEEAIARASKDSPAHKQALSMVAKLNVQLRASKLILQLQLAFEQQGGVKGRWKVTNKETMPVDMDRCFITNKGNNYDSGKAHPPEGHPKLHLLVLSNEEYRVGQAVREI